MINIFVDGVQQRNEDYLIIDLRAMSAKELAAVSAYNEMGIVLNLPDAGISSAMHSGADNVDWFVILDCNNDNGDFIEHGPFDLDHARVMASTIAEKYPDNVRIVGR